MKKLILPLILMPFFVHAQEMGLSDADIKKKFLSTVKDVEVEKLLGASVEFNKCRKLGEFKEGNDKTVALDKATQCFKGELSKKSDAELKKLSESLSLQDYGLVKSNNVNDVTEYLQKKMTKSLTGRDPDEKDPEKIKEQLKWSKQKIVDQKVFIDLYKNQLMKNALFEVSRYCFENLRITDNHSERNFATHWPTSKMTLTTDPVTKTKVPSNLADINDKGEPAFFPSGSIDTSKKDIVYKEMLNGLSGGVEINPLQYEEYFKYCTAAMPALCNEFKKKSVKIQTTESSIADKVVDERSKLQGGAASCLAMDRLRSLRKAMDNTDKVAKQFDEMEHKDGMALQMISDPLFYERGNNPNEESLDQLSTNTSSDMLANSESNKDKQKLEDDCRNGQGGSDCEDFLSEGDDFNKAIVRTETEMTLKREIEVARVKKMKEKELKEYLAENGMYELLNELETNPNLDIGEEIGKIYEARKIAIVEGLKLKVGRRQLTEKDADKAKKDKSIGQIQGDNIKASREEKARMAQLVLFNNIITSQLNLKDKDDKSLGRNVTAWNKEIKGISEASGMSEKDTLFQGLQKTAKEEGKKIDNASLVDGGIIDAILGKKSDAK
jgi:hypothetical protein